MRRIALLGLTLLLPACQTLVGSPLDGAGGFLGDTMTFHRNPNLPAGNAANMQRVEGRQVELTPLTPEPGNVWPGPAAPEPTLEDLERQQSQADMNAQPPPPRPATRGSSTPPGPSPAMPMSVAPQPAPARASLPPLTPPTTNVYPTPNGPAVGTQGGNGVQTYTDPKGGTGIVVPNGNGTSTLIGADGSVSTVTTPR